MVNYSGFYTRETPQQRVLHEHLNAVDKMPSRLKPVFVLRYQVRIPAKRDLTVIVRILV